jgi:RNA polymerase sigma factor (sigma-70 family)
MADRLVCTGGTVWLEPSNAGGATAQNRFADAARVRPKKPSTKALERSLEALYRREAKPLRQYVGRVLRTSGDAEDIVQEAFVRLWRAFDRDDIQNPRAVLFKTARNLALNHLRNTRLRNSEAVRAHADESFRRDVKSAEEELIAGEEAAACRLLMAELPLRCREAFVLRVVDELSYKEMAREMRLSVSTIEKHVGKGKQLCKQRLADAERDAKSPLAVLNSGTAGAHAAPRWNPHLMAAE